MPATMANRKIINQPIGEPSALARTAMVYIMGLTVPQVMVSPMPAMGPMVADLRAMMLSPVIAPSLATFSSSRATVMPTMTEPIVPSVLKNTR